MRLVLSGALEDLRLADLSTVLVVARHRSVTKAAKELRVTPSHVSRVLDRVEKALGRALFERTSRGLEPRDGSEEAFGSLRRALDVMGQVAETERAHRGVVVPSFLVGLLLPVFARLISERIRVVQGGANHLRAAAGSATFDFAVLTENIELDGDWFSKKLGYIQMGVYARPSFRKQFGAQVTVAELAGCRFICPVYWAGETLQRGDDGFPLTTGARAVGDEVLHVEEGLRLACERDQLVVAHKVVARAYVERGQVKEIPVTDWNAQLGIRLWSHGTRVNQATVRALSAALREALALDPAVSQASPASTSSRR